MKRLWRRSLAVFCCLSMTCALMGGSISAQAADKTAIDLLPTGLYYIQSKQPYSRTWKALDVREASMSNGGAVQLWDYYKNPNQVLRIDSMIDGTYKITPTHSGKPLQISNNSYANGAAVVQNTDNGSIWQRWRIVYSDEDSLYYFVNAASGKCLNVQDSGPCNGANVQQYEQNGSDNQKFRIVRADDDMIETLYRPLLNPASFDQYRLKGFYISPHMYDYALEIRDFSYKNGATLQLGKLDDYPYSNRQMFSLYPQGDGLYKIVPDYSGKPIEVRDSSHTIGADVAQWENHYLNCQLWYIVACPDGSYQFINYESRMLMDITSANFMRGTNIQQYYHNGTYAQKFRLTPAYDTY